mmetsp:Transcript_2048/g.4414  ORF Transcript_2048/g.4414 Transcript_2048/m.4414 type:complete len:264 (+) Transcript_2048:299-1090(+)
MRQRDLRFVLGPARRRRGKFWRRREPDLQSAPNQAPGSRQRHLDGRTRRQGKHRSYSRRNDHQRGHDSRHPRQGKHRHAPTKPGLDQARIRCTSDGAAGQVVRRDAHRPESRHDGSQPRWVLRRRLRMGRRLYVRRPVLFGHHGRIRIDRLGSPSGNPRHHRNARCSPYRDGARRCRNRSGLCLHCPAVHRRVLQLRLAGLRVGGSGISAGVCVHRFGIPFRQWIQRRRPGGPGWIRNTPFVDDPGLYFRNRNRGQPSGPGNH